MLMCENTIWYIWGNLKETGINFICITSKNIQEYHMVLLQAGIIYELGKKT